MNPLAPVLFRVELQAYSVRGGAKYVFVVSGPLSGVVPSSRRKLEFSSDGSGVDLEDGVQGGGPDGGTGSSE